LTRGFGNGEIDAQVGSLFYDRLKFYYTNAQEPFVCVNSSSGLGYGYPSTVGAQAEVFLDAATTLTCFASNFPRDGVQGPHSHEDVRIYGKVKEPVRLLCNGDKNMLRIKRFFVQEFVDPGGVKAGKALVYASTSGAITPFFANIKIEECYTPDASLPSLVRDSISGNSMSTEVSANNNIGYANTVTQTANAGGLKATQIARIGKIGAASGGVSDRQSGFFEQVKTVTIPAVSSVTVPVKSTNANSIVFISVAFNSTANIIFGNSASANASIYTGSSWGLGNAADPGAGVFRVWSSAANEITISNTNASSRTFTIWQMCPF